MEENQYACSENCPHYNKIKEAKQKEPTREDILKLSNMFKLFADVYKIKNYLYFNKRRIMCL